MAIGLINQAQNYAWGMRSSNSLVFKFLKTSPKDENLPYAELWMGTHSSKPSFIDDKTTLK